MAIARSVAARVVPRPGLKDSAGASASAARPAPTAGSLVKPATHIRRCTYRKVTAHASGRRELPTYEVDCLHPVYEERAVRLGDLADAYAACAACTLPGIFRADED